VGATGAVVCTAPSVPAAPAAGSSLTLTITATVPSGTADGTLLINVATVSGDQPEPTPDPHPNRDSALTLVVVPDQPTPTPTPEPIPDPDGPPQPPVPPAPAPDIKPGPAGTQLKIHKSATPRTVPVGGTINYLLRVSNIAEASALKVRVCDRPPKGTTVTSAPGFSHTKQGLCTTISKLRVRTTKTFHLVAIVTSAAGGRAVNHATVTASNAPSRRASAPTIVTAPPPVTG
jgi:uncharacterized repeat protein (TIGR01451 family)